MVMVFLEELNPGELQRIKEELIWTFLVDLIGVTK
jgi:hypothetical protein